MTVTTRRPLFDATHHAARAESLTDLARSASMSGWLRRNRRRDMLAAALVHATLGAAAMTADFQAEATR